MTSMEPHLAPSSQVTGVGDDMELSSDIERRLDPNVDQDLDIDLDLTADHPQDDDNDYIIEDVRSEIADDLPYTVDMGDLPRDDEMEDEERDLMPDIVEDATEPHDTYNMPDPGMAYDESAITLDQTLQDPADLSREALTQHDISAVEPNIDESEETTNIDYTLIDSSTHRNSQPLQHANGNASDARGREAAFAEDPKEALQEPEEASRHSLINGNGDLEVSEPGVSETMNPNHAILKIEAIKAPPTRSANVTEGEHASQHDEAALQHASLVHSVIVMYDGGEISLFPSNENTSETFFLQDQSLVDANLRTLLKAIRSVLADSIAEGDELEIGLDQMGLYLSENSSYAEATSLSQILTVYLQLCHHDGIASPEALYMHLTVKTGFSGRLQSLLAIASEGKGISQIPSWDNEDGEAHQKEDEERERESVKDRTNGSEQEAHLQTSPHGTESVAIEAHNDTPAPKEASVPGDGSGPAQLSGEARAPSPAHSVSPERPDHSEETQGLGDIDNNSSLNVPAVAESSPDDIPGDDLPSENDEIEGEDLIDYEDSDEEGDRADAPSERSSTVRGDQSTKAASETGIQSREAENNEAADDDDLFQGETQEDVNDYLIEAEIEEANDDDQASSPIRDYSREASAEGPSNDVAVNVMKGSLQDLIDIPLDDGTATQESQGDLHDDTVQDGEYSEQAFENELDSFDAQYDDGTDAQISALNGQTSEASGNVEAENELGTDLDYSENHEDPADSAVHFDDTTDFQNTVNFETNGDYITLDDEEVASLGANQPEEPEPPSAGKRRREESAAEQLAYDGSSDIKRNRSK